MKKTIFTTIFVLFCYFVNGQMSTREKPVSFKTSIPALQISEKTLKTLPPIDLEKLRIEDEEDELNGIPPRFGYRHEVSFNLENSGEWTFLPEGDRIWRLSISCPEALSINLLYNKFWLPVVIEIKKKIFIKHII